ncbi:MAG: helix-turn-helix domain-containing protein [Bdellovibrionota bacterium]
MVQVQRMPSPKNTSAPESRLRFFTSAEVAGLLKMNSQVITRKLQSGDIEGYKIGKDWRVSEEQLMAFLEKNSNRRAPAAQNIRQKTRSPSLNQSRS